MAGADDIKILSSFVYSKLKGNFDKADIEPVAATVMNRATQVGSLAEAVQSMNPTPEIMDIIQGNLKGKQEKEYKRTIQLSSKLLRGSSDPTNGATEIFPRHARINKSLGLIRTHGTKKFSFYRQAASPLNTSGMQTL